MKDKNKLSVDYGAIVMRGETVNDLAVIPGSPAAKAGIVENDIILEVDGKKITLDYTVSDAIQSKKVGDKVRLKILRNNQSLNVDVILEENTNK